MIDIEQHVAGSDEPPNRLAIDLTETACATALIMAAGVVTGLLKARTLGPVGRGDLTISTIGPITIVYAGTFGLAEATAYFTASRRWIADNIFLTTQMMAVFLGLMISGAGWFLLPAVLARNPPVVQQSARAYLLLFAIPCLGSISGCAWLQGAGHVRSFNIGRATAHVTTAAVMATLTLLGLASVESYLGAMLVGNFLAWAVVLAAWFAQRHPLSRVTLGLVPQILSYGSRVQIGSWSASANVHLDQLMLSSLAASAPLGLYVVAISYANLVATLPTGASMLMLPRLVSDCAAGHGGATLATWYRRVLWTTLLAGFCLWLVAGMTLPWLFGKDFVRSVSLVSILIPASCVLGMNQVLAVGFRSHGLPGVGSRAEWLGLIVTVPLLAVLLPRFGVWGAALTSLCAYSVSGAYLLTRARHITNDLRALWIPTNADWHLIRQVAKAATVVPTVS